MCYNNNRKRKGKVIKMITKTFEHKGQMINYYNKMKTNKKIKNIFFGYFVGEGYAIKYNY